MTPELNSLERNGRTVRLEPKLMQVLVTLAEHPGEVVSKEHIFHRVWAQTFVSDEVLTRSISELRKVFEDNPREPTYIQTIPKGGYRLVAPVIAEAADRADVRRVHWWEHKRWLLVTSAAMVLLAALAFFHFLNGRQHAAASKPRITSLAVLPLTNLSGDAGQDYFAGGMTDELTTRLSYIKALRVISRTSVMHYKGSKKTTPEIARELNVDALVEGSVLRSGDRVRISAQLIQAGSDEHLWAKSYERDLSNVLALQGDVARTIAEEINIQVTPQERRKLAASVTVNPLAHDSYLKGLYYWNKFTEDGMRKSIASFEEAIQLDPTLELDGNFADAHTGLGVTYLEQGKFPEAVAHLERATQLDTDLGFTETLAMAYAVSGNRNEARKILSQLLATSRRRYVPSVGIALIYLAMGSHDESCKWLEKGYQAGDSALAELNVDPSFAGLKSDPCFQNLTRRIGFP